MFHYTEPRKESISVYIDNTGTFNKNPNFLKLFLQLILTSMPTANNIFIFNPKYFFRVWRILLKFWSANENKKRRHLLYVFQKQLEFRISYNINARCNAKRHGFLWDKNVRIIFYLYIVKKKFYRYIVHCATTEENKLFLARVRYSAWDIETSAENTSRSPEGR